MVLACLLLIWVLPALVASINRASPFFDGLQRVAGREGAGAGAREPLRHVLSRVKEELPPPWDVALWIRQVPQEVDELVAYLNFWITASYLLYPHRVFPLSTPEVINQLEDRKAVAPPLAGFMRARLKSLASDRSPAIAILVWDEQPSCQLESLSGWPGARLLAAFPQGGCLFRVGGDEK